VTGAAGQIGYALPFRIASGEMLGKDQPVILQMLELPLEKAQAALKGVMMELEDCAFPLLADMIGTSDPLVAFKDVQQAQLVGAKPRGPGMERKDLLLENAKIFTEQGSAIGQRVTMGVVSDGSHDIPEGMIHGMPRTCAGGKWEVVKSLEIDAFSREKMDATLQELREERDGVKHLFA